MQGSSSRNIEKIDKILQRNLPAARVCRINMRMTYEKRTWVWSGADIQDHRRVLQAHQIFGGTRRFGYWVTEKERGQMKLKFLYRINRKKRLCRTKSKRRSWRDSQRIDRPSCGHKGYGRYEMSWMYPKRVVKQWTKTFGGYKSETPDVLVYRK